MFNGAAPAWDLDAARLTLAGLRALWLVGLLSSAGALLVRAWEPGLPAAAASSLGRLIRASLILSGVAWLCWVTMQSVVLLGGWQGIGASVQVLARTEFGRAAAAQIGLLGLAALAWRRPWPAAVLALAAVAAEATHAHAWAMEGGAGPLSLSVTLHLLAAAGWLGGLAPLLLVLRHANAATAAGVLRRFSRRALLFVLLLAATALVQGAVLVGGLPGLVGTAHGWMVVVKLALFAALLAFAASNRWRLLPRLAAPEPRPAQAALRRSLARETAAGLLIVTAASLLSALPPAMHAQPVWPFVLQPSLVAVREDAAFAREALIAGVVVVIAMALAVLAIRWRRYRRTALGLGAVAVALLWLSVPHLDLLLSPAYPTSFFRSPTGFAAADIVAGAALYPAHCARCHGAEGRGDGPDAAHLPLPPADLTAAHVWMHPDGELFWWLSHGMAAPDGTPSMPGFAGVLTEDARWQLIDFVRARNAGLTHAATGAWSPDLPAPDFAAECAGGANLLLHEMRGRPVRLDFADRADPAGPARVVLATGADAPRAGAGCVAGDPELRAAYAIVTGLSPERLAGHSVLIDAGGWLRDVLADDRPDLIAAALDRITAAPLAGGGEATHHAM